MSAKKRERMKVEHRVSVIVETVADGEDVDEFLRSILFPKNF